jgi:hypothetical protein
VFVRERRGRRVGLIARSMEVVRCFGEAGSGDFGDGAKWQLTLCTRVHIPRGAQGLGGMSANRPLVDSG